MPDARRRALLAALVGALGASVGLAGAGHAYLKEWRRALAWFSFVVGAFLILASVFSTTDTITLVDQPPEVTVPVLSLLLLSVLDAYALAVRGRSGGGDGDAETTCPHCGREVDPDLPFCHWCTEPIDPDGTGGERGRDGA